MLNFTPKLLLRKEGRRAKFMCRMPFVTSFCSRLWQTREKGSEIVKICVMSFFNVLLICDFNFLVFSNTLAYTALMENLLNLLTHSFFNLPYAHH